MSSWRDEWETRSWEAQVGIEGDRYRARIRTERGQVVRYSVQFEVWIKDHFYPAIRYDSAHGAPHRDTPDWHGNVVRKEPMPDVPYGPAVRDAVLEINTNASRFRREFEARKP